MTSPGDFSATTAGALVLGGLAAMLLATAVVLGGYGRPGGRAASVSATAPAPNAAGGALPEAEIEYLLDTND